MNRVERVNTMINILVICEKAPNRIKIRDF